MSRLGLGLLSRPRLPPLVSSLSLWNDPDVTTQSGGLVTAWPSRVGTAVFTATGVQRPSQGAGYIEFDGVNNFLSRAADAQSHPASLSSFTWAAWTWRAASALAVIYSSVPLFTASGGILVQDGAASHQYYPNVSGAWNLAAAVPTGVWVFQAMVYDAALAAGSRMAIYEGTSPAAVALVPPSLDGTVGNTGPAAATSDIARDAGLGRPFAGRLGSMYLAPGVKYTLPQLQDLAAFKIPS